MMHLIAERQDWCSFPFGALLWKKKLRCNYRGIRMFQAFQPYRKGVVRRKIKFRPLFL